MYKALNFTSRAIGLLLGLALFLVKEKTAKKRQARRQFLSHYAFICLSK